MTPRAAARSTPGAQVRPAGPPWPGGCTLVLGGLILAAPGRELFLVLGADAARNMPTWRKLEETRELATLVIVERAGDAHAEAPAPGWRVERVTIPRLDIASRDLRTRLAQGLPIDGLVPPAVVRAIAERGLYNRPR